ncbi:ACT domain-containing protein [Cytidiella melzeri]|nr:ACT domain-containing protein [Cytidiella melzeri]
MPPPSDHAAFRLRLLPSTYSVTQLKPDEAIPARFIEGLTAGARTTSLAVGKDDSRLRMLSITRTSEEISIVSEEEEEPGEPEDGKPPWRCIRIAGPMAFDVVGVMCNFTTPLKEAGVAVFVVSTWNTDYVLVPRERVAEVVKVLKDDGWTFDE